jgi:hypothetical protein
VRERWLLCPTPNWNLKTTLPLPTILVKSIWEFALARHEFGIWEFALARALARYLGICAGAGTRACHLGIRANAGTHAGAE